MAVLSVAATKRFNILSLDAAKYKGYMTAQFVSYMEQYAYNIAKRDLCIAERDSERISMPELFDLISGSETGAIIATTINLPNKDAASLAKGQKNQFFADKAVSFFENNVDTLYRDSQMSWFLKFIIIVVAIGFFGVASYWLTFKLFQVNEFGDRVSELQMLIKLRKRMVKRGELKNEDNDKL